MEKIILFSSIRKLSCYFDKVEGIPYLYKRHFATQPHLYLNYISISQKKHKIKQSIIRKWIKE